MVDLEKYGKNKKELNRIIHNLSKSEMIWLISELGKEVIELHKRTCEATDEYEWMLISVILQEPIDKYKEIWRGEK